MRTIKWASDVIRDNIREAKKYAIKAHEMKDSCRSAADWCRDMAVRHLEFNTAGHTLVKRMIEDYKASGEHSELMPGMMAVYEAVHADLMAETAEVRMMLEMYK